MSRKHCCETMSPEQIIGEMVAIQVRNGAKTRSALETAADALGLTPRRVFSVYYRQPVADKPLLGLLGRFIAWLEADIERAERALEQRRAYLAKLEGLNAGLPRNHSTPRNRASSCVGRAANIFGG